MQNAFSERIRAVDPTFNYHRMLVPDFLNEYEIGDFKALLTHLIRILHALDEELVHELDAR